MERACHDPSDEDVSGGTGLQARTASAGPRVRHASPSDEDVPGGTGLQARTASAGPRVRHASPSDEDIPGGTGLQARTASAGPRVRHASPSDVEAAFDGPIFTHATVNYVPLHRDPMDFGSQSRTSRDWLRMKYVVKKLRRSDLTFFEYQFRRQNAGNQKSLNLSRRVFIDVIFPNAPGIAAMNGVGGVPAPFHLPLTIYGPGERRTPQVVPRSVLPKTESQKNWRLNGEFVRDPDDDPTRYHHLEADDVAVLAFDGEAFPSAVTMVLLSRAEAADQNLRAELLRVTNNKAMRAIARDQLAEVIDRVAPPLHPIREILDPALDETLEDAALGSASAIRRLRSSGSARRMSARALYEARRNAENIGRAGEVLLCDWLKAEVEVGRLRSAFWVAETNAISPWDFIIEDAGGIEIRVELKSTNGPFSRPFHISQAEIEWAAAEGAPRTDLYRLFDLREDGASLRIHQNIGNFAQKVIVATSGLSDGILPDSYTVDPTQIGPWSETLTVSVPEDEDDE